jgi:hypothetical protein
MSDRLLPLITVSERSAPIGDGGLMTLLREFAAI